MNKPLIYSVADVFVSTFFSLFRTTTNNTTTSINRLCKNCTLQAKIDLYNYNYCICSRRVTSKLQVDPSPLHLGEGHLVGSKHISAISKQRSVLTQRTDLHSYTWKWWSSAHRVWLQAHSSAVQSAATVVKCCGKCTSIVAVWQEKCTDPSV